MHSMVNTNTIKLFLANIVGITNTIVLKQENCCMNESKVTVYMFAYFVCPAIDHCVPKGHHTPGNLVAATSCRQPKLLGDC